jgi:2-polyprenyl-6-hydroxyphenyl methylase/3-demethylubiquinone-9 3-methyltransferase
MLESSTPSATPLSCKICGGASPHFFRCDFHSNTSMHFGLYSKPIAPSGVNMDYYRCGSCGFTFSNFMDGWSADQFASYVYNGDYAFLDGSYNGYRGGGLANMLYLGFHDSLRALDVLDYGGGVGIQTALLKAFGTKRAETYDPFAAGAKKPEGKFNIVTCLEVLEHSTDPKALAADLVSLADLDNGFMLLTTQFPPADIEAQKDKWWYVAPRVGHVSFYTVDALDRLFAPWQLKFLHIEDHTHLAYRSWPIWANRFMPPHMLGGAG